MATTKKQATKTKQPDTTQPREWLTEAQAAARLKISKRTLMQWRYQQKPDQPEYSKVGHFIRYDAAKLDQWLDRHAVKF